MQWNNIFLTVVKLNATHLLWRLTLCDPSDPGTTNRWSADQTQSTVSFESRWAVLTESCMHASAHTQHPSMHTDLNRHTHTQIQTRELKGDLWSCKNTLRDEWLRLVVPVKQHLQHVAFMFCRQERDRGREWLSILDRHNERGGVNVTPGSQVELMHVKTLASGVSKVRMFF